MKQPSHEYIVYAKCACGSGINEKSYNGLITEKCHDFIASRCMPPIRMRERKKQFPMASR